MTEVSVQQPCSFSASSLDEEDNDVQEASDENHMFLMADENGGSSGVVVHHLKKTKSLQNYRSMGVIHISTPIWVAVTCEFCFLCHWAHHCPHMMFLPVPLQKDTIKRSNQMQGHYNWKYSVDMMPLVHA